MEGPRDGFEENMEGSFSIRRLNNEVIAEKELIREQDAIIQRKRKQISELNEDILGATNAQSEAPKRIKVKKRSMMDVLRSSEENEATVKTSETRPRIEFTDEIKSPAREQSRCYGASQSLSIIPQPSPRSQVKVLSTDQRDTKTSPYAPLPQPLPTIATINNVGSWPKLSDPKWISVAMATALRNRACMKIPRAAWENPSRVIYARASGVAGWMNGVDHLIGGIDDDQYAEAYARVALTYLTRQNSTFAWNRSDWSTRRLRAHNKPGGSSVEVWYEPQRVGTKRLVDRFWTTDKVSGTLEGRRNS